ncbi:TetR/AcrR family transcriptional regulator [Microbacterium sp. C23T]
MRQLDVRKQPLPGAGISAGRARAREQLLDAAYETFITVGIDAASIDQLSANAGLTRGAFYSNYSSKEEIVLAVLMRQAESRLIRLTSLVGRLARETSSSSMGVLELAAFAQDFLDGEFGDHKWVILIAEFEMLAFRQRHITELYARVQQRFDEALANILQSGLTRLRLEISTDPTRAARIIGATYVDAVRRSALGSQPHSEIAFIVARAVIALTRPVPRALEMASDASVAEVETGP